MEDLNNFYARFDNMDFMGFNQELRLTLLLLIDFGARLKILF